MRFKEWLLKEDFHDWDGKWVHYTKVPMMKFNPKMIWNDPFGIYLFPEKFLDQTQGQWHTYPYKYIVEFPPSMRVFDFSALTDEKSREYLSKIGVEPARSEYRELSTQDAFWYAIKQHFVNRDGSAQRGKMNAFFRKTLGFDAIFDDTNTVYHGETQLILLNPRVKYQVVDVVMRSGTGWVEFQEVLKRVARLCEPFGPVRVGKMERKHSWLDHAHVIKASVSVNEEHHREGPYCSWELSSGRVEGGKPEEIHVHLGWSKPELPEKRNMSIAATVYLRNMDFSEVDQLVRKTMARIWSQEREAA
jgi:hypothetical protein